MTPEQLADAILRAAGGRLEDFDPQSKERIIEAARAGMGTRWNLSRRTLGQPQQSAMREPVRVYSNRFADVVKTTFTK